MHSTCTACQGSGSIDTSRDPRHAHKSECQACSGFGTVEARCDCCCVEAAEIETGWDDIRRLCRECAGDIVRDMDDQPEEARKLVAKLEQPTGENRCLS